MIQQTLLTHLHFELNKSMITFSASSMKTYKNLSGKSGVLAYEMGKTFIKIKFSGDSMVYTYDYKRPGKYLVEQMKDLALKGKGLSDFILDKVGANFSSNK